jgi:nicotinamidase-related amidase
MGAVQREQPLPAHYDPGSVGSIWRVPYHERAAAAEAWRHEHGIAAAADDAFRLCLLAVDVQNTFCTPGFELFVAGRSGAGAVDDSRRLCDFVYRNIARVSAIVVTLDTHRPLQIFHPPYLVDADGRHPEPYTLISADDVEAGLWRVDPDVCGSLGLGQQYARRQLAHYTRSLERGGKHRLTVWPFHALLGGLGHALVPAVEDAFFFHSIVRSSDLDFRIKGTRPLTEHYSAIGPEVLEGPDGERLGQRDEDLVEKLSAFDALVVAGQAKSHCVAWTVEDLLADRGALDRGLPSRLYLLEDCTSAVVVPGAVDYTDEADDAFRRFAEAGVNVVRSTDPIDGWPGMAG